MRVALAYVVCALVWGTTWYTIRVCIGEDGYPTIPAAALRFTVAAAVLLPIWLAGLARPGPRGRSQWLWLVGAGLLNALGYSLVYIGEEEISGGLAAVLFGTEPLMVAILVTLTRTERVNRADVVGALIALVGIGIIFWDRLEVSAEQAAAVGIILLAVLVSSGYAVIVKRHGAGINPLASASVFLTVTAAALWVATLVRGWEALPWPPPFAPTLALLYLGVFGSVVAFATYFYLLRRVSLMTTMTMVFVIPIIALAVDLVWEEDVRLVRGTWIGIAVTFLGVVVGLLSRPRPSKATLSQSTPEI